MLGYLAALCAKAAAAELLADQVSADEELALLQDAVVGAIGGRCRHQGVLRMRPGSTS